MRAVVSTCQDCKETFQSKRQLTEHTKKRSCSVKKRDDEVIMLDVDESTNNQENQEAHIKPNLSLTNPNGNEEKVQVEEIEEGEGLEIKYDDQEDDEIEVVQANIYKYQGHLNYKQTVANDVFQFNYQDDEDDIIMVESEPEDDVKSDTSSLEEFHQDYQENGDNSFDQKMSQCDVCLKSFFESELEDHLNFVHPIKSSERKEFAGGNFFLMVS